MVKKVVKKKTVKKTVSVDVPVLDLTQCLDVLAAVGRTTPAHHAKNATKEVLLVMRSILDEAIKALDKKPGKKKAKKKPFKVKIK